MSALSRPFDDQSQKRIQLETSAIASILALVEGGDLDLVGSDALNYENGRNPDPEEREATARALELCAIFQDENEAVRKRAGELVNLALKGLDALHLACAEQAGTDVFVTCDDRMVRRYAGAMRVLNPLEFVLRFSEYKT